MIGDGLNRQVAQTSDEAVLADRRRPGRRDVDPALIPLMRGQVTVTEAPAFAAAGTRLDRDDLAPVAGIATGVGISLVAWAAFAMIVLRV